MSKWKPTRFHDQAPNYRMTQLVQGATELARACGVNKPGAPLVDVPKRRGKRRKLNLRPKK